MVPYKRDQVRVGLRPEHVDEVARVRLATLGQACALEPEVIDHIAGAYRLGCVEPFGDVERTIAPIAKQRGRLGIVWRTEVCRVVPAASATTIVLEVAAVLGGSAVARGREIVVIVGSGRVATARLQVLHVAVIIAQLAFTDPRMVESAKLGILVASAIAAAIGVGWLVATARKP